tara:strand:- start:10084 stop:11580 length:1497 start_codon:yes stop_codon:yes gene_type:complete
MYLVQILINTLRLKSLLTLTLVVLFGVSFAQKAHPSIYKKEFKQFRKLEYNINLISRSKTRPDKKWDNYKGGAINTSDSLFLFDDIFLSKAFPTNSDKIRNEYLAFYFSQKTAKCPTLFSLLKYYEQTIEKGLIENDLPKELKLLPVVCSAFNPNSDNGIGGYGYWHLNYPQAIKYGLTINRFVDERSDFEKSTKAATLYIKDLYSMYNDWELTLTAYSCGVSSVNKLLNRYKAKKYKEIFPFLPTETKDLVQAFVAMNYIYNYDNYGAIDLNPIFNLDTIHIERKLQLEAINYVIGVKSKDLILLNPTLTREILPNNFKAFFPKGKGEIFIEFKDSIYFYQDSVINKPKTKEPGFTIPKDGKPYTYTVRSGDVLGLIAGKNNVRVSQIQDWNGLSGTRINVGQKLTIYGKSTSKKKPEVRIQKIENKEVKKTITKETSKPKTQNPSPKSYSTYIVKSGDNLWIIAKKYSGVSAQNIMDYNSIDGNLNIGQSIKIPKY